MLVFCPLGTVYEGVGYKEHCWGLTVFQQDAGLPTGIISDSRRALCLGPPRPGFQCLSGPVAEESSGAEAKLLPADAV